MHHPRAPTFLSPKSCWPGIGPWRFKRRYDCHYQYRNLLLKLENRQRCSNLSFGLVEIRPSPPPRIWAAAILISLISLSTRNCHVLDAAALTLHLHLPTFDSAQVLARIWAVAFWTAIRPPLSLSRSAPRVRIAPFLFHRPRAPSVSFAQVLRGFGPRRFKR
jgi:hypothetical protein